MIAPTTDSRFPRSWRIRSIFRDASGDTQALPLPRGTTWPFALMLGGLCAVFAIPWIGQIRDMIGHKTDTVDQVAGMLFDIFFALGWSVGVIVLFVLAVGFAFYRNELRSGATKLIYVTYVGPLGVVAEFELSRIRNVRPGSAAEKGLTNICFDYDGVTTPLPSALPAEAAGQAMDFIRRAVEARSASPATLAPLPDPERKEAEPPAARSEPDSRSGWLPALFLVGANLVPLFGVLELGWDIAQIMVLFWVENVVVAIYALAKLAVIQRWGALLTGPFLLGHFGAFMALHFMFVYYLFVRGITTKGPEPAAAVALSSLFAPLWTAILAIFISHGVSFFSNFLGRREYVGRTGRQQMAEPYRRLVVMHVTLIFGGMAIMALGQPIYALTLLVVLKIGIDLYAHLREHRASK